MSPTCDKAFLRLIFNADRIMAIGMKQRSGGLLVYITPGIDKHLKVKRQMNCGDLELWMKGKTLKCHSGHSAQSSV